MKVMNHRLTFRTVKVNYRRPTVHTEPVNSSTFSLVRKPLVRTLACNKRPCHNGGTCLEPASEDQNTNGYTCSCPPGYQGKTCEEGNSTNTCSQNLTGTCCLASMSTSTQGAAVGKFIEYGAILKVFLEILSWKLHPQEVFIIIFAKKYACPEAVLWTGMLLGIIMRQRLLRVFSPFIWLQQAEFCSNDLDVFLRRTWKNIV